MTGRLVRTYTSDNLNLQGMFCLPQRPADLRRLVIHIHGSYGNFYENVFLDSVSNAYTTAGTAFLSVNTRGHDYYADLKMKRVGGGYDSRRIGGILELFEESLLDIRAWIDFAVAEGFSTILLQGHSLGSMKAVFYGARGFDERVKALILVSPPDILGVLTQGKDSRRSETLALAQEVAARNPAPLMPVGSSYDPISAGTYASLHGDPDVVGMFSFAEGARPDHPLLSAIRVPVYAVIGSRDEYVVRPVEQGIDLLGQSLGSAPKFTGKVIPGANHVFDDAEGQLAEVLAAWAQELR